MIPIDDILGPVASEIGSIIQNNVSDIDRVYTFIPDGPPETNAIVILFTTFEIMDDTNGKLYQKLNYNIRYVTRRKEIDEATKDCYSMYSGLMKTFASWSNQTLGGLCNHTTIRNGAISQIIASGQVFMSLIINLQVYVEMNIPT